MYQLTRYLYELSEVKANLILSLLNNDSNQSLYWAFEYYYSGYYYESINFIIQIYYDFYYVLNPTFEKYLFIHLKKVSLEEEYDDLAMFIKLIIKNLSYRPYTLDIFLLRNMGLQFEVDFDDIENIHEELLTLILDDNNYVYLSSIIMQHEIFENKSELKNMHSQIIDEMSKHIKINKKVKMKETNLLFENCYEDEKVLKRTILLSKLVNYHSIKIDKKMHRSIYIENKINEEKEKLYDYKTKYPSELGKDTKYVTNTPFIGIFKLERFKKENSDFIKNYLYNWEYYAHDTPYWTNLFALYEAYKDNDKKKIIFDDEENEIEFYEDINYFPDEVTQEVQNRSIGKIEKITNIKIFVDAYGSKNVVNFDDQYINDLEQIDIDL